MGYDIEVDKFEYKAMPKADKWQAHHTAPVTEFFTNWSRRYAQLVWMLTPNTISGPTSGRFYSRADNRQEEEDLCDKGLVEWQPDTDIPMTGDEMADDPVNREGRISDLLHVAVSHHG